MIKTSNKMIGEIEYKELYDSDDDVLATGGASGDMVQDPLNFAAVLNHGGAPSTAELDLGGPREKKQMDFLLKKIADKKQAQSSAIEHQAISLGFV